MSDPFGQLEEQLRGAVARRRRAARWLRRGGLAVLGAGLAGGGVAIAGGMLSSDGPSPAARAIAVAEAKTRQLPVCTARWKRGEKSRLVAGDVPAIIRKQFAVFRRPTRPGELRSFNQGLLDVGGRDVL
ncbi:MAG TPA: hypothetical protein VFZ89_14720, partial [Solirubrobacteraceae bacterium]